MMDDYVATPHYFPGIETLLNLVAVKPGSWQTMSKIETLFEG